MVEKLPTCSAVTECGTRRGQLLPRQRCSRANETQRRAAASEGEGEGGEGQLGVAEELLLLMVMAMGLVDAMWKGTRQMGQATLCFALAENICKRQSVQYLQHRRHLKHKSSLKIRGRCTHTWPHSDILGQMVSPRQRGQFTGASARRRVYCTCDQFTDSSGTCEV